MAPRWHSLTKRTLSLRSPCPGRRGGDAAAGLPGPSSREASPPSRTLFSCGGGGVLGHPLYPETKWANNERRLTHLGPETQRSADLTENATPPSQGDHGPVRGWALPRAHRTQVLGGGGSYLGLLGCWWSPRVPAGGRALLLAAPTRDSSPPTCQPAVTAESSPCSHPDFTCWRTRAAVSAHGQPAR